MLTRTKEHPETKNFLNKSSPLSGIKPIRQDGNNRTLQFSDLPNYKNILLLQGPVGPFFKKLGNYWLNRGSNVFKVNFNSGDDYFYHPTEDEVIHFKFGSDLWPIFLSNLLVDKKIKAVFLFGDCRPFHHPVRSLSEILSINYYVLEEGYIRPHLFTLEKKGVNYYSHINDLSIEDISKDCGSKVEPPIRQRFDHSFWHMVRFATVYWFINLINQHHYPLYKHHRVLDVRMGYRWTRSVFRYWLYRLTELSTRRTLLKPDHKCNDSRWFLLPLQVHDDSQIKFHSDFESIDQILFNVIHSFSIHIKNTASSDLLIIKHHPMDRGHNNYKKVISQLAKIYCIEANIVYIHDIKLPYLLKKISGCLTVNSTIGLQSLHYQCPVINLGKSFYDKPGLTFQGSLDEFWISRDKVNAKNAAHFRNYLLHHTQVNGSLYDPKYRIE
jgi:capsular polysaccharide export protein